MNLLQELKRRNVFRVGIAYAVAAWLLLQIADVMIDNIGAPDWVFPTLLMALAIGFPLALIFAWAFELTPEGIKREHEVDRQTSITGQTGRKLDRAIIVVLALAVGYLLVDKLLLREPAPTGVANPAAPGEPVDTSPAGASVAVLPFTNMSNDPDNEYFSDGLTDTLLHMLAQLPELRVAARTSSFAFKGQNKAVPEIAATLGVENILEGSVQRAGDQVRVTAQLIRADDGFHVWSQNYTRPMQDIFAIQDEIATDVAAALGASLLGAGESAVRGVETTDLTAYDRYLKGLEQQAIFTYASLEEAENHFEQALAEDPGFTEARLALVRNYMLKRMTGIVNNRELVRTAKPLVQQVLEQEPENKLAIAFESMLDGRFNDDLDSREQIRESIYRVRDLLAYLPTETFVRTSVASGLHFVLGESQMALEVLEAGLLIDPLDADLYIEQARILLGLDRLDEAESAFRKAIELAPENPTAHGMLGEVYQSRGDFPGYLEQLRRTMELDPQDHEIPYEIAMNLYALELPEEGEMYYSRVQALAPGSSLARALAVVRADALGRNDRSLELARAMIADQVDDRRGAFQIANLYYVHHMMLAGRSDEAWAFLQSVRPEVADFAAESPDFHVESMKYFAIMPLTEVLSPDDMRSTWNDYVQAANARGFPLIEEGNRFDIIDAIIRGEIDRAVTTQIEHRMSEPVALSPWRHREYLDEFYAPIISDPRYMAALDERQRQAAADRASVQELLMSPEWND